MIPLLNHTFTLRTLFRSHIRRMTTSGLVSGALTMAGFILLWCLVSGLGINALYANIGLSPVMTIAGYAVNKLIWHDRDVKVKVGLSRWFAKWAGLGFISQGSFAIFVGLLGCQYLAVRICVILALALPSYATSNGWVFANSERPQAA